MKRDSGDGTTRLPKNEINSGETARRVACASRLAAGEGGTREFPRGSSSLVGAVVERVPAAVLHETRGRYAAGTCYTCTCTHTSYSPRIAWQKRPPARPLHQCNYLAPTSAVSASAFFLCLSLLTFFVFVFKR